MKWSKQSIKIYLDTLFTTFVTPYQMAAKEVKLLSYIGKYEISQFSYDCVKNNFLFLCHFTIIIIITAIYNTVYAKIFALENFREIYSNSISWKKFTKSGVLLKPHPFMFRYQLEESTASAGSLVNPQATPTSILACITSAF